MQGSIVKAGPGVGSSTHDAFCRSSGLVGLEGREKKGLSPTDHRGEGKDPGIKSLGTASPSPPHITLHSVPSPRSDVSVRTAKVWSGPPHGPVSVVYLRYVIPIRTGKRASVWYPVFSQLL